MRSQSMSKFLGGSAAAVAVKIVTGFAIAAAASVVAAEVAVTGSANPADWGRHVSHKVTLAPATGPATGPAASAQQPADIAAGHTETTVTAGSASADTGAPTSEKLQDNPKTSRPSTAWFTEPNDPAIVAVQTKFVPKP
jgi:hypothetical protein